MFFLLLLFVCRFLFVGFFFFFFCLFVWTQFVCSFRYIYTNIGGNVDDEEDGDDEDDGGEQYHLDVEMEMVERLSRSSIMVELNIETLAGEKSGTRPGRHQQLLDPPNNCRRRPGQVYLTKTNTKG